MSNAPIQHPVIDLRSGLITKIWALYFSTAVDGGTP
jgi:hypothetical protein